MGLVSGLIAPVLFMCIIYCGRGEMAVVTQRMFTNAFSWMKLLNFKYIISLKCVPSGLIDNTLWLVQMTPNRWQAIIGTSDGQFYWCIYASRGFIELIVADGQSATISQDGIISIKGERWEVLHFTLCINFCKILTHSRVLVLCAFSYTQLNSASIHN